MEKNEIIVDNHKVGQITTEGYIVTRDGNDIYCGDCVKEHNLNPKLSRHKELLKEMRFYINEDKTKIICSLCGRELPVTKTYEDYVREQEIRNREKLENLKVICVGDDWECGLRFYGLSAKIDYDDWLKVKKYFSYKRTGWSRSQELEWNFGEPTGWITRNGYMVQQILFDEGLIKEENLREFEDWEKCYG